MRKLLIVSLLAVFLLTGCASHTSAALPAVTTAPREEVTLLDNEQLTITTDGRETVLTDHTEDVKMTYRKELKPGQSGSGGEYTARESYQSEAVTVYIRGGVLVILTDSDTFII